MAPSTAWTRELYAPPKSFHSERVRGGVVIEFSTGEAALYSGELLLRVLSGADFCKAWNRWTRPFPPKVARRETWRPSSCVELEEEITRQAPARSYECFRYEWTVHASSITVDHIGEIAQLWLRDTGDSLFPSHIPNRSAPIGHMGVTKDRSVLKLMRAAISHLFS